MSKVKIISIIYAIGIIIGALFLDVWGAETTPQKSMSIFAWTIIFLITLFFTDRCYFKFGIYTNANQKAEHKHLAEGMTVFTDYMAMANTEEKLEALLLKDK